MAIETLYAKCDDPLVIDEQRERHGKLKEHKAYYTLSCVTSRVSDRWDGNALSRFFIDFLHFRSSVSCLTSPNFQTQIASDAKEGSYSY